MTKLNSPGCEVETTLEEIFQGGTYQVDPSAECLRSCDVSGESPHKAIHGGLPFVGSTIHKATGNSMGIRWYFPKLIVKAVGDKGSIRLESCGIFFEVGPDGELNPWDEAPKSFPPVTEPVADSPFVTGGNSR
jgi:hypothetical protein